MQHEALTAFPFQRIEPLFIHRCAERRHDQRLRFAARKERRPMRARQDADFAGNRANLFR